MKIKLFLAFLFAVACSATSVYVYMQIDPRLEIILLKNEEILQLDNKIAALTEKNSELSKQVNSIVSVVKTTETDTGKINDEYKVCLRTTDRLKKKTRKLTAELSVFKNKNKILQEYVSVKNDVTALKEQIAILNGEKKNLGDLVESLGPVNMDHEGATPNGPVEIINEADSPQNTESSGIPPVINQ